MQEQSRMRLDYERSFLSWSFLPSRRRFYAGLDGVERHKATSKGGLRVQRCLEGRGMLIISTIMENSVRQYGVIV